MAKDKKNEQPKKTAEVVVDSDNISKVVRNNNVPTVELTQQVYADIAKDKNDRLVEAVKSRALKSEYMRRRKLIQLRARRRENDITKEFLQKAEILQYQMAGFKLTPEHIAKMGGKDNKLELEIVVYDESGEAKKQKQTFELKDGEETWVPASITTVEYDDLCEKMKDEEAKAKSKADTDMRKDLLELESQYPGYFSYGWRW